jgi:hypothetical protein
MFYDIGKGIPGYPGNESANGRQHGALWLPASAVLQSKDADDEYAR